MKRSANFIGIVEMENGVPVGDGADKIEKIMFAAKDVAARSNLKCRIRLTARGSKQARLADCVKAAAYFYMVRI